MFRGSARLSSVAVLALAVGTAPSAAQDRTQDLLGQARAAVGGSVGGSITGFAATASIRTMMPMMNMEITRDVEIECVLPDKYRKTETLSLGGMRREVTMGINGDVLFYDDGGQAAMMGMDPAKPGPVHDETVKNLRREMIGLLAAWLVQVPDPARYTFSHAGVAEAPDGKADILDLKGPGDLALRLFLDAASHRVLMTTRESTALDQKDLQALQEESQRKLQANPDVKEAMRELREAMDKLPKRPITIEMRLSDYKSKGGLSLPHTMAVSGNPQASEEWSLTGFKLNPSLKPDRFEKK